MTRERGPVRTSPVRILAASRLCRDSLMALAERHDLIRAWGRSEAELRELVVDREVIILRSGVTLDRELIARAPRLELIIRAGSGVDNIDLDAVEARGIGLVTIPEPGAAAVAELAFALMLNLARKVLLADRLLQEGHWAKHEVQGQLLRGKSLGVVGVGNIGTRVGELGVAFGMEVRGCVENPSREVSLRLANLGIRLAGFRRVLSADFVTVHVPLQEGTHNLIGERELTLMKPGAFLVNLARGGVVDEQALRTAVVEGRLGGAALDVHEREGEGSISPLAGLPNVILTPHLGATTTDTQQAIGRRVLQIVEEHARDRVKTASGSRAPSQTGGPADPADRSGSPSNEDTSTSTSEMARQEATGGTNEYSTQATSRLE